LTLFARKALSRLGNVLKQCQKWHLRHTLTFRTRFPGVATFNIVGPEYPAEVKGGEPNNIEDGTLRRTRAFVVRASRPHSAAGTAAPQCTRMVTA